MKLSISNNKKDNPIYVFDVDGTVADLTHRLKDKDNKDLFFSQAFDDKPIDPTINILNLLVNDPDSDVVILTARPEKIRSLTIDWFSEHTAILENDITSGKIPLFMYPEGLEISDAEFKRQWWGSFENKDRIAVVFEDRNQCVEMWRSMNIQCFQVAEGNF